MMQVRLISPDAPEWTELRSAVPHDVYDGPAYVSLSAWLEGGIAAAVFVEHAAGGWLLVPIIIRDIEGSLRDASSPYGYPGVLTDRSSDPAFVQDAMHAAINALRGEGIVALFLRLHPLLHIDGLEDIGSRVTQATIAIDLSRPAEELWAETRNNHRRDIRKARRYGYEFDFDCSAEGYEEFQRIYHVTMDRLNAAGYYRFPKAYFDRLAEAMEGRLHLAAVRVDGQMAAAGLFTECDGIVQSFLIGTAEEFMAFGPAKLLYHGVSMWAKERGNRWFHIGGGYESDEDSLFHFKAGFSHLRTDFATLRVVVRHDEYRTLMGAHKPSADAIGVTGYFPGYRDRSLHGR